MADFTKAFNLMIAHEGGYVYDPDDPGGETKFGITKRSYPNIDIKNLTIEHASSIYKTDFWDKINGDMIASQQMANSIFDFAVNAGIEISSKLAQKVVGIPEAEQDGKLGKNSIAKLNIFFPEHFQAAFTVEKIRRYISICKKRPESKKYFFGWIDRAVNQ